MSETVSVSRLYYFLLLSLKWRAEKWVAAWDSQIHQMTYSSPRESKAVFAHSPGGVFVCVRVCVEKADWCPNESGGIRRLGSHSSQILVQMQQDSTQESGIDLLSLFTNSWLMTLPSRVGLRLVLWQLRFMESLNSFIYDPRISLLLYTQLTKPGFHRGISAILTNAFLCLSPHREIIIEPSLGEPCDPVDWSIFHI